MSDQYIVGKAEDFEQKDKGPGRFTIDGERFQVWSTVFGEKKGEKVANPSYIKAAEGRTGKWTYREETRGEFTNNVVYGYEESGAELRAATDGGWAGEKAQGEGVSTPARSAKGLDTFAFGSVARIVAGLAASGQVDASGAMGVLWEFYDQAIERAQQESV